MRTPSLNKGLEFTDTERTENNLHGLLPSAIWTPELHLEHAMKQLRSKATPLEKYIFMQSMQVSPPPRPLLGGGGVGEG